MAAGRRRDRLLARCQRRQTSQGSCSPSLGLPEGRAQALGWPVVRPVRSLRNLAGSCAEERDLHASMQAMVQRSHSPFLAIDAAAIENDALRVKRINNLLYRAGIRCECLAFHGATELRVERYVDVETSALGQRATRPMQQGQRGP